MENGRQRAGYKERMRDMALRQIRTLGDEVLTKKCREVKEMTPRLRTLAADMLETMYHAEGVGLAVVLVRSMSTHPAVMRKVAKLRKKRS